MSLRELKQNVNHSEEAIETKASRLGLVRKYDAVMLNKRVAYLDIETFGLNADFHFMLCWSIKEKNGKVYCDKLRSEDFKTHDKLEIDKRLTQSLIDCLSGFDIVVTYYGTGFDLPFVRSRALLHKLEFPSYGSLVHIDLYYVARAKLKIHSNRLASVCDHLGIIGKTPLDGKDWIRAALQDDNALNRVLHHNKMDVIILEKAHNRLQKFMAGLRRSV